MPGAVRPGLLPSKRRSDQPGDRGTGGSPCSAGLRLLMAQFLSFRTRNRGRKRGKEASGERRGAKGRCALELARTPRPGPALTHLPTQGQAPGVPEDRGLSRGAAFPNARGRGGQHQPGEDGPGGQWGPVGSRHRGKKSGGRSRDPAATASCSGAEAHGSARGRGCATSPRCRPRPRPHSEPAPRAPAPSKLRPREPGVPHVSASFSSDLSPLISYLRLARQWHASHPISGDYFIL